MPDLQEFFGLPRGLAAEGIVVRSGRYRPPGAVILEVEPFLEASLTARGLPSRFKILAEDVDPDLPDGEMLWRLEDDWPERPIAVRTASGEVVVGFDPERAIARMLASGAGTVSGDAPWGPSKFRLFARRLASTLGAGPRTVEGPLLSADALRFAVLGLLEEAGGSVTPRAFWPDHARMAFALVLDITTGSGLERIPALRRAAPIPAAGYLDADLAARRPDLGEKLQAEGLEVGLYVSRRSASAIEQAKAAVPYATGVRVPAVRASAELAAALAASGFAYSITGRPFGEPELTVFPHRRGGVLELGRCLPGDFELKSEGASAAESLKRWRKGIERVRRLGGLAVLRVHPDAHLLGGDPDLRRALQALVEGLREDPEVWIAAPEQIATWWRFGRHPLDPPRAGVASGPASG